MAFGMNTGIMSIPEGISAEAWVEAVNKARGDRIRLAKLVASGKVQRVRGRWQLPIPNLNERGMDTIRPNKKNRRR